MDQKELQKIVNPIYTTAKGTVMTLAVGGDSNAIALYPYLEFEEIQNGNNALPEIIRKVYTAAQEARFKIYNNAVLSRNEPVVVDLPSGYSPRGFVIADAKRMYYGFDLPSVIDLMKPAAAKTMTAERIADVCKNIDIWTMTLEKSIEDQMDPTLPFAVESDFADGRFSVRIQGRLDTITAPELLKKFREIPGKAEEITIDVSRMAYVSSAGLRVFLMMYKSLENKSRFKMTGVSEVVREILKTTGFDQFLLC